MLRKGIDVRAVTRAREYLDAELRTVRSGELEEISGLSRYELARQFRVVFGTSPYRYSVLRRLDFTRTRLKQGATLAEVALESGFADQAHFTRMFTASFGLPPGRYAMLDARGAGQGPRPR